LTGGALVASWVRVATASGDVGAAADVGVGASEQAPAMIQKRTIAQRIVRSSGPARALSSELERWDTS